MTELVQTYKQEVTEAACELIYPETLVRPVVEIARYLIQEHIVNPRCSQAELVTSAALAGGPAKSHKVIKKTDFGDSSSSSSSLRPGDKSAAAVKPLDAPLPPSSSSSSSLRPAVEAFMKQLPRILPRSSLPDKTHLSVSSSPSLLTPPPSLAAKEPPGVGGASAPGGQVKVISMGGGALPVMILPQSVLTSAPPPPPQLSAPTSGSPNAPLPPPPFPPPSEKKARTTQETAPRRSPAPSSSGCSLTQTPSPSHMPIITSVTGGVIQLLQSAPPPHWEIQGVIQKAPRPGNNMLAVPSAVLPPPTLHDDDQVEITLTPVELHLDTPTSYSSAPTSCSSLTRCDVTTVSRRR
ncbi:hypothetical protein F7725_024646 [Dissostichus mawsoni]|uniref:Uncharacterized protein n=1 Tax=Dissostichus mawsoni TaxID=36200 RepID=A0A7J5X8Y9_DISMA|nr:hypothetical protein F7725_024646 [Dissostichus mawsoni]